MRYRALLLAACLAVIVSWSVPLSEPASGHENGIDYIQFNMWGRVGHEGRALPVERLMSVVGAEAGRGHIPHAISLQEVCHVGGGYYDQTVALVANLPDYTVAFAPTVSGLPDKACPDYGIALAMLGARGNSYWTTYELPERGNEPRYLLCGHAALSGERHNACNTHLDNNVDNANDQVGSVIWNAAVYNGEHAPATSQYLGGDFNIDQIADEFAEYTPYDHWTEADQCCNSPTFSTLSSMTRKLDYAFVAPNYVDSQQAAFYPDSVASDHAIVVGFFDRS